MRDQADSLGENDTSKAMAAGEIVPHPNADVVASSEVPSLMDAIRPQWQAKGLIERVRRLLPVDPSSACQLFNARTIPDLVLLTPSDHRVIEHVLHRPRQGLGPVQHGQDRPGACDTSVVLVNAAFFR